MNESNALWLVVGIFIGWLVTCLVLGLEIDATRIIQRLKALKLRREKSTNHQG